MLFRWAAAVTRATDARSDERAERRPVDGAGRTMGRRRHPGHERAERRPVVRSRPLRGVRAPAAVGPSNRIGVDAAAPLHPQRSLAVHPLPADRAGGEREFLQGRPGGGVVAAAPSLDPSHRVRRCVARVAGEGESGVHTSDVRHGPLVRIRKRNSQPKRVRSEHLVQHPRRIPVHARSPPPPAESLPAKSSFPVRNGRGKSPPHTPPAGQIGSPRATGPPWNPATSMMGTVTILRVATRRASHPRAASSTPRDARSRRHRTASSSAWVDE